MVCEGCDRCYAHQTPNPITRKIVHSLGTSGGPLCSAEKQVGTHWACPAFAGYFSSQFPTSSRPPASIHPFYKASPGQWCRRPCVTCAPPTKR